MSDDEQKTMTPTERAFLAGYVISMVLDCAGGDVDLRKTPWYKLITEALDHDCGKLVCVVETWRKAFKSYAKYELENAFKAEPKCKE